ncbi:MAG: DUF115 domain-containing protein [Treponema sp.]|nr:DUF115 domain-containing protein [Treponema sp.]
MTDLSILENNYPGLLLELEKHDDDEINPADIIIEETRTGQPVLKIRGHYIHSPRDPVREAARQAEICFEAPEQGPVILLGFGLGYIADAVADASAAAARNAKTAGAGNIKTAAGISRPIIIVERRRELLRLALRHKDIGPFLTQNKVIFIIGRDSSQITGALSLLGNTGGRPLVIKNRALTDLDEAFYNETGQKIQAWITRTEINTATLKRFGRRWVHNLSRNLDSIRDLPGISRLEGLLEGINIPVFLAAAGPGLDTTGQYITQITKRCLVIAVDTSLRFLLKAGIQPDFAVSLDPQYWNFRHLDRTAVPGTCLIAESAVYPPCLRQPFKKIYLCGSLFPIGRYIEDSVDPKGEVGSGGSVATAAWDFARILGAGTVWIAGLDLSFPDLKTHFRGALFEEKSHSQSNRFLPAETISVKALRDGSQFYGKNIQGNPVLTDQRLSIYAAWFENRFAMYPKVRNISLSAGGLAIKGLETGSMEDLLALPERRGEINSLLNKADSALQNEFYSVKETEARASRYEKARNSLIKGLQEIEKTAKQARNLALAGIKTIRNRHRDAMDAGDTVDAEDAAVIKKLFNDLEKANLAITGSAVKEVAGFLFPDPVELEKKSASAGSPLLRHLEYSANFYSALAEAANYNLRKVGRRK